jgi:hypothetical protein
MRFPNEFPLVKSVIATGRPPSASDCAERGMMEIHVAASYTSMGDGPPLRTVLRNSLTAKKSMPPWPEPAAFCRHFAHSAGSNSLSRANGTMPANFGSAWAKNPARRRHNSRWLRSAGLRRRPRPSRMLFKAAFLKPAMR